MPFPLPILDPPTHPSTPPGPAPFPGMAWIPGGTFKMGSDSHYPEEAPQHLARVDGFWLDQYPVTNSDFRKFVDATGYVTFAEIAPDPAAYPGALPEMLHPGSVVFKKAPHKVDVRQCTWWDFVLGADWRHPQGPESSIEGKESHPVVHVAYKDVEAYAKWAGKDLPSEAEWEFAARGGLDGAEFAWGDQLFPDGKPMANTWQGEFPWQNLREDGFEGISPVDTFPANGYGLQDMIGNTWEWTTDFYAKGHEAKVGQACCAPHNPRGASEENSYDPRQPEIRIPRKVIKVDHTCAHRTTAGGIALQRDLHIP